MLDHRSFIRFAGLFEASLAILAVSIGWLAGITPGVLTPDVTSLAVGVGATLPLGGLYYASIWVPIAPLRRIHE